MLAAALLSGIVIALIRLGENNSSVTFYTAFVQLFWAVCFTPIAILVDPQAFVAMFHKLHSLTLLIPIGMLDAVQVLTMNFAVATTLPAYATAVQSTSIFFGSVFGAYVFKEKLGGKLLPTCIIIMGVVIISVAQAR